MVRGISLIVILSLFWLPLFSQSDKVIESNKLDRYFKSIVVNGDTIPEVMLKEVKVIAPFNFRDEREYRQYHRLIRDIELTLPFARLAAQKLEDISEDVEAAETRRERRRLVRDTERELFDEYEDSLRSLSFRQGRLLMRLIDRETGDTTYEIIREYKGGVSAFFWQGIARIFGANLKDEYEPDRKDLMIEHIIERMDAGVL
ncbi:DUF4294 domain-containing protein [Marinilabiliaceae bacterium ANBcel2]|nr:DUF4294 domain-containing protein [Marinilabiliaceae bacterium ANBcel2]